MAGRTGGVPSILRPACQLAVRVARDGEREDPSVPAPPELRPVLGFSRLSAAAYRTIAKVVDDDGGFRARVALGADAEQIGQAGLLWLERPVGWSSDPAFLPDAPPARPKSHKRPVSEDAKHKKKAEAAESARKKAVRELAEARKETEKMRVERDAATSAIDKLHFERNAAVRDAKAREADLAEARRAVKVARAAATEAETELLALKKVVTPSTVKPPMPTPIHRPTEDWPRAEVAASVQAKQKKPRRPPALPPGLFDGSREADRHLVGAAENLVVVDGYNVSRAAWSDLAPAEERRRTVALLEEVQARSGGRVIVVFDGQDKVSAPMASKVVRVQFSATGQTADDAIAALLGSLAPTKPVVVVSSDRSVAADARRQGASVLGSRAFLDAVRR